MAEEKYKNNEMIFKVANKSAMVIFEDYIDEDWDMNKPSRVIVKFIQTDNNDKTIQRLTFFLDPHELMSVMGQLINGTFSKTIKSYTDYGGSVNGGKCVKANNGELKPIISSGPESRIFSIYTNNSKLVLDGKAYKGKVINNGAIKKVGDELGHMYFQMDIKQALTMAEAIYSYLYAKKTVTMIGK